MNWYRVKFDEILTVVCDEPESGHYLALSGGNMGQGYTEGEAVWNLVQEFYTEAHEYREKFNPQVQRKTIE